MTNQKPKVRKIIKRVVPKEKIPRFSAEQVEKFKTAGEVALGVIAVVGTVSLALVAPKVFYAIDKLFYKKSKRVFSKKEKTQKIARTFYYLKDKGYIKMKLTKEDVKIFFTKLGRRKLRRMSIEVVNIKKPRAWDGKWWQVAADIPTEDHKRAADLFRQKLKDIKFFSLQRTLWFYPHDPRSEIEYITNYYQIGRFVTVMEISRMDKSDEKAMKKYFRSEQII